MKRIINVVLGACVILFSQCNSRSEFTVQGTAILEGVRGGLKRKPVIFDLTLENRSKEYRITAKALDGEWYNNEVAASDGTLNYFLEQDWPSLNDKIKDNNYQEFGKVGAGAFPEFSATPVQLIWLAYCSQPYFNVGTNNMKIPLFNTRYAPTDGMKQIVSFSESNPNILEKIQCFATNILYVAVRKTNILLQPPYDKGYLLWQLKITAYTNIGKLTLPLSFEYEQYFPKATNGANGEDVDCLYKGRFTATNIIETVSSVNLLPVASKKDVPVADWSHNFPSTGQVTPVIAYTLNDNKWKDPNDQGIQNQVLAIKQEIHLREPPQDRKGVRAIVIAFLGASFLLLCWFIKREVKHKSNN